MPTYNYICENELCKHDWEIDQKINDPKIKECPKCHELKAKRLISGGTSFQLDNNGKTGWSKTNYSSNK